MKPAIEIKNVSKKYRIGERQPYYSLRDTFVSFVKNPLTLLKTGGEEFWALKNISFSVNPGEVVGIIGKNGAGKSTLLKILSRITPPSRGEIRLRGRTASLLEVGTGFHPELTGRENIFLNGSILGMTRNEIRSKFDQIVAFSEIEQFLDTPVKHYSSGMHMRLAFAVAAHLEPEILLVDEVLSVGDAEFQRKSLGKMKEVSRRGRTVIFVSHNLSSVTSLCNRVALLGNGKIVDIGDPKRIVSKYLQTTSGVSPEIEVGVSTLYTKGFVKLTKVRAITKSGDVLQSFDITKPIGIEINYEVLKPGSQISCNILVRDSSDIALFQSPEDVDFDRKSFVKNTGHYKSICWIPGNFLSEGMFSVRVLISVRGTEKTAVIDYKNAITFHVHDELRGDSVRGKSGGQLKGLVRPNLVWERKFIERSDN